MTIAALIAFSIAALFFFFAVILLVGLWHGGSLCVDPDERAEMVTGCWSCLGAGLVFVICGALLW